MGSGRGLRSRRPHLAAAQGPAVLLWDIESRRTVAELKGHSDEIVDLAFTADGRLLATASRDGTAGVWDVAKRQRQAEIGREKGWVVDVAFFPDGQTLAYCSVDGAVKLWDVAEHRLRTLPYANPSGYTLEPGIQPRRQDRCLRSEHLDSLAFRGTSALFDIS